MMRMLAHVFPILRGYANQRWLELDTLLIRESVDSLCRDGVDPPIVRVHRKTFLTRERSRSKPFCAPSYSIPAFLYPKIPLK